MILADGFRLGNASFCTFQFHVFHTEDFAFDVIAA
jgi:hypothetical protein